MPETTSLPTPDPRATHGDRPGATTVRAAALDCGTNSVRLLVADVEVDGEGVVLGMRELTREMTITRLGRGVDRTGAFDPAALDLTLEAIDGYAARCRELGVPPQHTRLVATSASRDAANRGEFETGVTASLGVAPEVVSGEEEAALSFAGAAAVLDEATPQPVLVVDIGGGSTELVLGSLGGGVEALVSIDVGSVRVSERHVVSDPPTPAEIDAARVDVRGALDAAARRVPLGRARTVVGLAGSVTTLTAHALGLQAYDREAVDGTTLSLERWNASCDAMIAAPRADREAMGFLHPGRVDVIAAGSLVWQEVLARVAAETAAAGHEVTDATVSEHDILDGIAASVARREVGGR